MQEPVWDEESAHEHAKVGGRECVTMYVDGDGFTAYHRGADGEATKVRSATIFGICDKLDKAGVPGSRSLYFIEGEE